MQQLIEITFRNMDRSDSIVAMIEEKCKKLEHFYQHIIDMLVIVEMPQRRQTQGRQYQITIKVHVPGKTLLASRTNGKDLRSESLPATINDTFHSITRQLEDFAERQRGHVKQHTSGKQSAGLRYAMKNLESIE